MNQTLVTGEGRLTSSTNFTTTQSQQFGAHCQPRVLVARILQDQVDSLCGTFLITACGEQITQPVKEGLPSTSFPFMQRVLQRSLMVMCKWASQISCATSTPVSVLCPRTL